MVEEAARGPSHAQTQGNRSIDFSANGGDTNSPLFRLTLVLVRLDHVCKALLDADLVPSKISTIVLGGTAALHTVGVGGGNFLITKSDAFDPSYHSRPNSSTSEIRSTPRFSLRGRTSQSRSLDFFEASILNVRQNSNAEIAQNVSKRNGEIYVCIGSDDGR